MIKQWEKLLNNEYKCLICGKEYSKKGIGTHFWRNHGNGINHGKKTGNGQIGRKAWNKGLNKKNDKRVKDASEKLIGKNHHFKNITKEEFGKKMSKSLKNSKVVGGIRKGAGRGKSGWYKGYWCDSSWELAFVIYNLEHNIEFKRNKKGFKYIFEGNEYKYYPDFIIDNEYYEIKGYEDKKVEEKNKQFNKTLHILKKEEMKLYLDYAINKYSKNFIELYEGG